MKYLQKYLKYKGKYIEAKYGGYQHKEIYIDENDDDFVVEAIQMFNSEIGKYLKNYLDSLASLIVSNNIAYQNAIDKNEQFLLTIQQIYNQFVSFLKNQDNEFDMKEFIKMVNSNLNFNNINQNNTDQNDIVNSSVKKQNKIFSIQQSDDDTIIEIIIE